MDDREHEGATDDGRPSPGSPDGPAAWEVEHRLSRIEAILLADLDKLGEAVLGATVARLDASISALVERIDAVDAPPAVSNSELMTVHQRLDDLVVRLDDLAARLGRG